MTRYLPAASAFVAGLAAVAWVGFGPLGASAIASAIVFLIAAAYLAGGFELWRFARANSGLQFALAKLPAETGLEVWIGRLDASLQHAVRQRVEGARTALPGPVLTPTLVGLLVLLGMLGTFVGMVVTLDGAVQAMQGTSDLATMRAALAAPVKGLGLAFGTSVAGVAASAMLGLTSALLRRERVQLGQQLDALAATTLRPLTLAHQEARTQAQTRAQMQASARAEDREHTQQVVAALQSLAQQMDQRDTQWREHQAASQAHMQAQTLAAFTKLAASVDHTLSRSLSEATQAASAAIQPALASTLQQMAHETAALQQRAAEAVAAHFDGTGQQFTQTVQALATHWDQALTALMARLDTAQTASARALQQRLDDAQAHGLQQQRASNETLAEAAQAAAAAAAELSRWRASAAEGANTQRQAADAVLAASAQVGGGAAEVSALAEVLLGAVRQFGDANATLVAQLQRVEAALSKSSARSDEQLAFYVAQARELVDLSIASQQQVTGELQRLAQAVPV